MAFDKATVKKQIEVTEEGETEEIVDVHLKYVIPQGLPLEAVRQALLSITYQKFNDLYRADLDLAPRRLTEMEQWKQERMFPEGVPDAVERAAETIAKVGEKYDSPIEMHTGGVGGVLEEVARQINDEGVLDNLDGDGVEVTATVGRPRRGDSGKPKGARHLATLPPG